MPVLFLVFLVFLPFAPLLLANKSLIDCGVLYCDLTNFYYALKVWYQQQLLAGHFPFWTNLVGNGYPIFAEGELGALYPPNLLLYLTFPVNFAFNLNIIIHFLWAAIGTYLFCRVTLRASKMASFLGGIAYSLSGFFFARLSYVNMIFVVAYFPMSLLLTEKLVSTKKLKFALLLAIVFSFQILAGYNEIFFYSFSLTFGFLLLLLLSKKTEEKRITALILFFLSLFLSLLVSAVQLLPNWEVIGYSHRAGGLSFESATASVWPLSTLSLFLKPHAFDNYQAKEYHPLDPTTFSIPTVYGYIGFLTFVLAIVTTIFFYRKRFVFIFAFLTLFAFLWAQGRFSPLFVILWQTVPVVKFFRVPVKLLFTIDFFLVVLAVLGFDAFQKKFLQKRVNPRLIIFGGISFLMIVYGDLLINNKRLQPLVPAQWVKSVPPVVYFLQEALDTNFFQIYSHGANNFDYQTTKDFALQKDFQNVLPPDLNMAFGIPANREVFALFLQKQQKLNSENTVLDLEKKILRLPARFKQSLSLQGVKLLLSDLPIEDKDLILVKEIPFSKATSHRAFLSSEAETVHIKVDRIYVYENKSVYPRLNFVTKAKNFTGRQEEDILSAVLDQDFNPTKEVLLEEKFEGLSLNEAAVTVEVKKAQEGEQEYQIKTDKPGLFVRTTTFYPGWQATLDGKPTKIYRANYAFQAIAIPQGEHSVKFAFVPTYWKLGLFLSAGSVLIILLGLILSLKKKF